MHKKFKILIFSLFFLLLCSGAFLSIIYYNLVSKDASARIRRGAIEKIIFSESPVYYDDGQTPIGVFFEKTHRKYIRYKDTPKGFIKAIIAAEDKNFFNHPGFDIRAVIRALIANIRARRTVQGGSTITQQTAKNIFKRQQRSYTAKLKELFQALLLEKNYTKEEILELYINQFFVTGFGRGLRIAAEYFFDKEAENLDLVESAFIAGSVKGPSRYNPFTKKTEAEKEETMRLAKLRKDYVLAKMRRLKFITKEQYLNAREREVPFKEGKVTYRLNVILDFIREQLLSVYYRTILEEQGIENIATSGIRIYTSINKEIQEGALRSIRRHLPLLDIKLSGYNVELLQGKYKGVAGNILKKPKTHLPFLSRITEIHMDRSNPYLIVSWDKGGGIIDYDGLKPIGEAWLKWKLGNWAIFDRRHLPDFLKNFHVGDLVHVKVLKNLGINGKTRLMLSKIPELEGGIIVIRKGMIKAMVGGFFDRFFNRAVDAKRQLGSIFKPILYTAALQLKWNSLDSLINKRDYFRFENTFYMPKPDHKPKSDRVSLTWAGVKSENLATVWLLYHLTDRLNMSEFRQVVELLGLAKKESEPYEDYVKRIRDKHGVIVNNEALMEAAFEEAKEEIKSDMIFSGHEDALENLVRLHFNIDIKRVNLKENNVFQIYRLGFIRLRSLNFEMKRRFIRIQELLDQYTENKDPGLKEALFNSLEYFYLNENGNNGPRLIYTESRHQVNLSQMQPVTPEWILSRPEQIFFEEIWIDGLIPSEVIDLLQSHLKKNFRRLLALRHYDLEVLFKIRDFRTLVNLFYSIHLSKKMGISTKLDPVLSFPLGPNSISIMEAASVYQTIMTGHVYPVTDMMVTGMVPIITRILDRDGETIWEYTPKPKQILNTSISVQISEILRLVMERGTGKKARDAIQLSLDIEGEKFDISIPSFGKTGTANRFTNSSFVGFIPGPKEDSGQLDIQEGYVVASYVGYDDNRPMQGKHISIYGSSGALPLWVDTTNTIVNSHDYKNKLDHADLAFDIRSVLMPENEGFRTIPLSDITGLPLLPGNQGTAKKHSHILSNIDIKEGKLEFKRVFDPIIGADHEGSPGN